MVKILVLGATGYVGKRVADALVRSGQHQVFGLARTTDKVHDLAVAEVMPVLCEDVINEPGPYLDCIRRHNIDMIVDVSGAGPDSAKFLSHAKAIAEERNAFYKSAGLHVTPKLGFVYCSGTWVHGSSQQYINDLDVAHEKANKPPEKLVAWRTGFENDILEAKDLLDVAIVRPALIYGRENTIWTSFLLPLLKASHDDSSDTLNIPLESNSKLGLIHVDDVATGFQCVIERLSLVNGGSAYPVFDLVTSYESMENILSGFAAQWKYKGAIKLVGPGDDLFAVAMGTTFRGSSDRARQLLGWEPKRWRGLVTDIDIYAASFASQH